MLISSNSGLFSGRGSLPRYTMLDSVDFFHSVGFEAFDINFSATIYNPPKKVREFILDGDWEKNIDEVGNRCAGYGIQINTSHLPFFKYSNRSVMPEEEYRYNQKFVYLSLDAAIRLGVKWTVVHTTADPQVAYDYIRPLCEYATPHGLGIAVENVPSASLESLNEVVDLLKRDGYLAGICYDTGHANVAGLTQREAIHTLGSRIEMLHVHDNFGKDQHQPPFCGTINWTDVMQGLAEVEYNGDFNFEVNATNIPESARIEHAAYLISLGKGLIDIYNQRRLEL